MDSDAIRMELDCSCYSEPAAAAALKLDFDPSPPLSLGEGGGGGGGGGGSTGRCTLETPQSAPLATSPSLSSCGGKRTVEMMDVVVVGIGNGNGSSGGGGAGVATDATAALIIGDDGRSVSDVKRRMLMPMAHNCLLADRIRDDNNKNGGNNTAAADATHDNAIVPCPPPLALTPPAVQMNSDPTSDTNTATIIEMPPPPPPSSSSSSHEMAISVRGLHPTLPSIAALGGNNGAASSVAGLGLVQVLVSPSSAASSSSSSSSLSIVSSSSSSMVTTMIPATTEQQQQQPPPSTDVDYVLVLDKSGSMRGQRESNLLRAIRAMLQLLMQQEHEGVLPPNEERVTLIAFEEHASVISPPASSSATLDRLPAIEKRLRASGGTSIAEALRVALEAVAEPKLARQRPVVVLLLTDGDDLPLRRTLQVYQEKLAVAEAAAAAAAVTTTAATVAAAAAAAADVTRDHILADSADEDGLLPFYYYTGAAPLLSALGTRSGLSLHFVGICADADSVLLDGLAALAHGTFVCLRDGDDMRGLMGSLLGLVLDQFTHEAALLSLSSSVIVMDEEDADDNNKDGRSGSIAALAPDGLLVACATTAAAGAVPRPIQGRRVHLRAGIPTLVPFELVPAPTAAAVAAASAAAAVASAAAGALLRLQVEVQLLKIGAVLPAKGQRADAGAVARSVSVIVTLPMATIKPGADIDKVDNDPAGFVRTAMAATAAAPPPSGNIDWQVALECARVWYGEANAVIAPLIGRLRGSGAIEPSAATDAVDQVLAPYFERFRALMMESSSSSCPPLATVAAAAVAADELSGLEAQLRLRRQELILALHDLHHAQELSARSASDASTVRNGGISLGNLRIESDRQASMRTASMAFD